MESNPTNNDRSAMPTPENNEVDQFTAIEHLAGIHFEEAFSKIVGSLYAMLKEKNLGGKYGMIADARKMGFGKIVREVDIKALEKDFKQQRQENDREVDIKALEKDFKKQRQESDDFFLATTHPEDVGSAGYVRPEKDPKN